MQQEHEGRYASHMTKLIKLYIPRTPAEYYTEFLTFGGPLSSLLSTDFFINFNITHIAYFTLLPLQSIDLDFYLRFLNT